jgi:glucokinase
VSERSLIGVDLGGTNVRAGRVVGQRIVSHRARTISSSAPQELVVQEVVETIRAVGDGQVSGIGIGVPSVVDVEEGVVYAVENIPSWQEVPLKEILEQRCGLPVRVNNDANCFALGEYYFGSGQGHRNLVGMVLGTGLGAGIITEGRLYCGSNCGAGEIGAIPYKDRTIEAYCSGEFFRREHGIDGATLFAQAQAGDSRALSIFEEFGAELGHAVLLTLYAYDPEVIVLGGSVSRAYPFFEPALRRRLSGYAYQHALERLVITVSATPEVAILGAAALHLDARRS